MRKYKPPKYARTLSPDEAALRFGDDPASIVIPLPEFFRYSKMTQDEFLAELQSGRLQAHRGPPDAKGQCAVFIKGDEAVRWLAGRIEARRKH
jgi:hypothetical protein